MHPIIAHEAAKARFADWRRRAESGRRKHGRCIVLGRLARRGLAMLAARSPRPAPSQPARAPKTLS
jgi:hypothetical protein